jgi:phosphatidylinositol alpha-1,6-mannosyltransferase
MPKILKSREQAHLLLVGSGPYRRKLENLIVDLNLQNHVTFTGRVQYQDLPAYLSAGDIFAMPARSRFFGLEVEGLGIVYLEASSCGLPVLAGDSGGAPDAVDQGVTGLVVNGLDVDQVALGVIQLLSGDRKAMGRAGREFVVNNWDWSIWAKRFNELLELN